MSTGTTLDGKPVQVGDYATAQGNVASVSGTFVTITLGNSGASVTVDTRDVSGRFKFGTSVTPAVGERVSFNGQVTAVTNAASTATLTLQMRFPVSLTMTSSPPIPATTVNIQAQDCVAGQSL